MTRAATVLGTHAACRMAQEVRSAWELTPITKKRRSVDATKVRVGRTFGTTCEDAALVVLAYWDFVRGWLGGRAGMIFCAFALGNAKACNLEFRAKRTSAACMEGAIFWRLIHEGRRSATLGI